MTLQNYILGEFSLKSVFFREISGYLHIGGSYLPGPGGVMWPGLDCHLFHPGHWENSENSDGGDVSIMEKRSVKPGNYNREMKSTKVLQGGKVIFLFSAMTSSIPGEPCSQTRSPGGQGLRLAHTSAGQQGQVCQHGLDLDTIPKVLPSNEVVFMRLLGMVIWCALECVLWCGSADSSCPQLKCWLWWGKLPRSFWNRSRGTFNIPCTDRQ